MRNLVSGTGLTKDGANINWIFPLMQQNNQDECSPEFLQGCLCHWCLRTWECFIQSQVSTPACKDDYSIVTGSSFTFSWFLLSWNMTSTCERSSTREIFPSAVKPAKKSSLRYHPDLFMRTEKKGLPSQADSLARWPDKYIVWQNKGCAKFYKCCFS